MDIAKRAQTLARKYQSHNPFEIVKGMNVILVFAPLIDVRGFYQYFQRNNIIYIDESLSFDEKKEVCGHEMGHMTAHKKANTVFMDTRTQFNTSRYEIEANTFAAHLLIPDDILSEYQDYTIEQLSRLLGYREELVRLRLRLRRRD